MSETKTPMIYVGKRITTKNRLAQFWEYPNGYQVGFTKFKLPASIGEIWVFTEEDGQVYTKGPKAPIRGEFIENKDQILKWSAEEQVSVTHNAKRLLERRLSKRPDAFDEAIEPLRKMFHHLDYSGQAAFLARIISKLYRGQ